METALSLIAALCYGTADFCGGVATRRSSVLPIVVISSLVGWLLLLVVVPIASPQLPTWQAVVWGMGAGVSGGLGLMFLYLGLASGAASVVAPISAAIGTAIPVVAGLAIGESPSSLAWCGIIVAALAIMLLSYQVSSGTTARIGSHPVFYAVVSGLMIGVFLVCYGWSGKQAGLWPLLAARSVAVTGFLTALLWTRTPLRVPASIGGLAMLAGVLDIIANGCYLVAARTGSMSIVATLANLYPVATVVCAAAFLHERPNRLQSVGLLLALAAIVLLTR